MAIPREQLIPDIINRLEECLTDLEEIRDNSPERDKHWRIARTGIADLKPMIQTLKTLVR